MAGWTGLEPAASAVTGRRYNQLNYHPAPSMIATQRSNEGYKALSEPLSIKITFLKTVLGYQFQHRY